MRNYAIAGAFSSGKGGTVTVDNELSPTSVNPVQNKVITGKITDLEGKIKENGDNGKSAYEIAVTEGFEGTEKEWLESLKGEMGPEGPQGPKGDTGSIGPQGPQGEYAAIDAELSADSNNPVANKTITKKIAELEEKISVDGSNAGYKIITGTYTGGIKNYQLEDETVTGQFVDIGETPHMIFIFSESDFGAQHIAVASEDVPIKHTYTDLCILENGFYVYSRNLDTNESGLTYMYLAIVPVA